MKKTTAVITGGTSGIGKAAALRLAAEGCDTLFLLARSTFSLKQTAAEIAEHYPNCSVEVLETDVTKFEQVQAAFTTIGKTTEQIDYLFLAAGDSRSEKLAESRNEKDFAYDLEVNLVGTYSCLLCAKPLLGQGSSVVTVASIRGQLPSPSGLGYAAAKGGMLALTRSAALQLAPDGIRVNCVSPSAVYPTGMSGHWSKPKRALIRESMPLKFIPNPDDIANAVWFLLSPQSRAITGQTLSCNAGDFMA